MSVAGRLSAAGFIMADVDLMTSTETGDSLSEAFTALVISALLFSRWLAPAATTNLLYGRGLGTAVSLAHPMLLVFGVGCNLTQEGFFGHTSLSNR